MKSCYARFSAKRFEMLVRKGWTDQECADFFDLNISHITAWKNRHPEFLIALKNWKESADFLVEKSLFERAMGIKYDEVTYEQTKTGGLAIVKDEEIQNMKHTPTMKVKVTTKFIPPDPTAMIFWLKNRKPSAWRDRESNGQTNLQPIINIYRSPKDKITVEQKEDVPSGRRLHIDA